MGRTILTARIQREIPRFDLVRSEPLLTVGVQIDRLLQACGDTAADSESGQTLVLDLAGEHDEVLAARTV